MSKRNATPMAKPHRVVQVPAHTRNGKQVRGHSRRVLLKPPYVPDVNAGAGAGDYGPGYLNGISTMGW